MRWDISGKDNLNEKQYRDTGFSVPEIMSGVRPRVRTPTVAVTHQ